MSLHSILNRYGGKALLRAVNSTKRTQVISQHFHTSISRQSVSPIKRHLKCRFFSSSLRDDESEDEKSDYEGISSFLRQEMAKRHSGIQMNPKGFSNLILPNEQVVKEDKRTETKKTVGVERLYGYFWMLKDLQQTDNKPIISNGSLIRQFDAQIFPPLDNIILLATGEEVRFPQFLMKRKKRSCTLLTIAFNDFGNKLLSSWTEPFEAEFASKSKRVQEIVNLTIQEGRVLNFLKPLIVNSAMKNIPQEKHGRTLLYFGECDKLRDMVRMHNNKTSFVYLLDAEGRVRFAGSGKASNEEVDRLIEFAKKLSSPSYSERVLSH